MPPRDSLAPVVPNNLILAVSGNSDDLHRFHTMFAGSSWELHTARTLEEAGAWLRRNRTAVVLCKRTLPDGSWKDLLEFAVGMAHPPSVVIFSRHADDYLWTEVLNLGGFDVLPLPAGRTEVFRTVSSAWRNWSGRSYGDCAPYMSAMHSG